MAKLCAIAGALAGCACAADTSAKEAFEEFVAKYHRSYETEEEHERRFEIFAANVAEIEAANGRGDGVTFGINEFADLTKEEFRSKFLGGVKPVSLEEAKGSGMYLGRHVPATADLPDSVDWVERGAVNTPMAQKHCGSCWTFSTTGALEGAWQIATGELKKLSEQQLVDCARTGILNGCHGGDQSQAFHWLEGHHVCTEQSYPYTHVEGQCAESVCEAGIPKGGVTGYKSVAVDDTEALRSAVAQQPVSISIDANETVFQLYDGGIIKHGCGSDLDHAVLLVGYGTEGGVDYWKVKNSWGADWGEGGYVRIKRGLPKDGECGIKAEPVYPVVSADSEATLVV